MIQSDLNIEILSNELCNLDDMSYSNNIKKQYTDLLEMCSGINVSKNIAISMLKTIETF